MSILHRIPASTLLLLLLLLLPALTILSSPSSSAANAQQQQFNFEAPTCPMRDCPSVCSVNCSDDPLIPLSTNFMENFLSDKENLVCGDIPAEYPDFVTASHGSCPDSKVDEILAKSLDITSIGIVGILGAMDENKVAAERFQKALKAVLTGVTVEGSPLRGVGNDWLYHQDKIITQTGGLQGYYFNRAPCKKDAKLNTSMPVRPDLFTTSLLINAALVTYAKYAVPKDEPEHTWPISESLIVAHLEAYSETMQRAIYLDNYIQEYPAHVGSHSTSEDEWFETSSASHAMVLRVADYALTMFHNGYLPSLPVSATSTLSALRTGASKHVVSTCAAASGANDDPLIEGFKVWWPKKDGATVPPVEKIPARDSLTTSVFIAALGPVLLQRYCSNITTTRDAGDVADELVLRVLKKFGREREGAATIFWSAGIKFQGNPGAGNDADCIVDVFQTAWLRISAAHVHLVAQGCDILKEAIATSPGFLRTFCRSHDSVSSWQQGFPACGDPVPSLGLTVYTTMAELGYRIFQDPPAPPPPPPTSAPPKRKDPNAPERVEWKQAVIGVSCGAILMVGIFFVVRYLQQQSHHRNARLVGTASSDSNPYAAAASQGTFM